MVTRRPPRMLPSDDALLLHKILIPIFLGMVAIILWLAMATAALNTQRGQLWHLPWPIVQWALTTPLGTLAVALVGGLVGGLPLVLTARAGWLYDHTVDVTALPPIAWPRPLPPWRRPGGPTRGENWLGRGRRERVLSRLALAFAVLLVLGLFAVYMAIGWYGITHLPDCSGSRCPPRTGQVTLSPFIVAFAILILSQYGWIRYVERRCGIWFRVPYNAPSSFTCYIRRPGVTAEAAATALARYTRGGGRPAARRNLITALALVPLLLIQIALALLGAWLPTQWIPT